jgi:hypothetical protein
VTCAERDPPVGASLVRSDVLRSRRWEFARRLRRQKEEEVAVHREGGAEICERGNVEEGRRRGRGADEEILYGDGGRGGGGTGGKVAARAKEEGEAEEELAGRRRRGQDEDEARNRVPVGLVHGGAGGRWSGGPTCLRRVGAGGRVLCRSLDLREMVQRWCDGLKVDIIYKLIISRDRH